MNRRTLLSLLAVGVVGACAQPLTVEEPLSVPSSYVSVSKKQWEEFVSFLSRFVDEQKKTHSQDQIRSMLDTNLHSLLDRGFISDYRFTTANEVGMTSAHGYGTVFIKF